MNNGCVFGAPQLLARKQGRLAALEAQEAKCREELEKARGELEEFLTNREKLQYDIEVPLLLRQGQVESMPGPGQSLLEDGILIDVEEVQGINTAIR